MWRHRNSQYWRCVRPWKGYQQLLASIDVERGEILRFKGIPWQGLFLSVLPKTQFPKNAKTQFENAKTQFENPKTQFGNCKTLENRQFYASHQNKFNSLNQFCCNQQKIILKPHFHKWCHEKLIQKMQNLNLSKQKFLLKIQKLNLKMLKLKKPRKYLRKFSWIDAQKKSQQIFIS